MSTFRRRLMMSFKKPTGRLPSEYQEVEYIKNEIGAYINTGYYLTGKCDIVIDFIPIKSSYSDNYGNALGYYHGSSYSDNFNLNIPVKISSNPVTPTVRFDRQSYNWSSNYLISGNRYTITFGKSGIIVNGTSRKTFNSYDFTCSDACYIFKANGSGTGIEQKIYSFKIYKNNVLEMDLVPCYRKSDTEIGFYDIVNNQFYINAGTETFTKGADV